ncbi:TfoX/Sxy family protein [Trujillonella endophytica]|uniref:TfoX N-terminal domain-containing protein n=1 Tax=Trujillonella endophytica TaxID=673521 RepID=A0A1H8T1R8_9ACTN|nr:TfoX/Sxy family protein [Trujillella endophytica]SEO84989.1 TfoX N-terminal domain-containing protein [Trujillella endophytica]
MPPHPELLARVRLLLADRADVVEGRMVGGVSFTVGGRLACGVTSAGLAVRVGRNAVAAAATEPHVGPLTMGGRPLVAYVLVDPAGCGDEAALQGWLDRGLAAAGRP